MEIKTYNYETYDFKTPVCEALARGLGRRTIDLTKLHTLLEEDLAAVTRETDQRTPFHTAFYDNIHQTSFYDTYHAFLREVIQPMVGRPMYAQKDPNFRVQLPNNRAVGIYHRDSDFGHRNIINFWLPLVDASGSNTIHLKGDQDEAPSPVSVPYGSFLRFDAENILHGNEMNTTPVSRVSLDFRIIPKDTYQESDAVAINTGVPLNVGGYYMDIDG